jgi:hypothetical protein
MAAQFAREGLSWRFRTPEKFRRVMRKFNDPWKNPCQPAQHGNHVATGRMNSK